MIAMMLGLEFRWRDLRHRALGDIALSLGSAITALAQGITPGAILRGVHVENDAQAGGWLDWLSAFSLPTRRPDRGRFRAGKGIGGSLCEIPQSAFAHLYLPTCTFSVNRLARDTEPIRGFLAIAGNLAEYR